MVPIYTPVTDELDELDELGYTYGGRGTSTVYVHSRIGHIGYAYTTPPYRTPGMNELGCNELGLIGDTVGYLPYIMYVHSGQPRIDSKRRS